MTIQTVELVEILPTKIWSEKDVFGTVHIKMQHRGIEEFDFMLRKKSLIVFKSLKESGCNLYLHEPKNNYDSLILLVYFEIPFC